LRIYTKGTMGGTAFEYGYFALEKEGCFPHSSHL